MHRHIKKAYTELMKINQNLGKTIRRLESEVNIKDILLDECEKKNADKIKKLESEIEAEFFKNNKIIADLCEANEMRRFYKKIIDKLIQ